MRRITMKYALSLICLLFALQAYSQWSRENMNLRKKQKQDLVLIEKNGYQNNDDRSRYSIPRSPWSVIATDIDLDGENDIFAGHKFSTQTNWGGISELCNNGEGEFNLCDTLFVNHGFPYLSFDHLNNNDFIDLYGVIVTDNPYIVYVSIFYDYALNSFENQLAITLSYNDPVSLITSGDINNDNNNDIVFASNNGQYWSVMFNNGDNGFLQPEYYSVGDYFPSALACGDLNEDGRDDVVVCGQKTEVYFSYPSGFEPLLLEEQDFKNGASIVDFDHDGDNDLLTFVGIPIADISLVKKYENLGSGTLDTLSDFTFEGLSTRFFVTDFNNDSLPDILFQLTDKSGYVIYYNLGDFQLGDSSFVSLPAYAYEAWRNVYCEDMDGNGCNDIITVRTSNASLPDNLVILFNNGNGEFGEDPITEINNSQKVNFKYHLTCYPNPLSSSTCIEFHLMEESTVALEVYDYTGKKLKTIKLGLLEQGRHSVPFYCGDLAPGVYFYSLVVNGRLADSRKMSVQ
ncbi:MAG: FG-GAP-like repeat-containing protein [Bacteroidales bacterium]|nr:FG-GAP-like repeat-containing protein [Bacteroidales bacterium]MCF8352178.1 FG-GAP-like repeat-containing protein [Bacteroidales bacterium]MCF8377838.1 FG-GAP-like repeat-containing protein [Bacteroidales bacterium]MCF8402202.1 FG-GAP-like repeat-containing protein [Bacteroidales bacterium]